MSKAPEPSVVLARDPAVVNTTPNTPEEDRRKNDIRAKLDAERLSDLYRHYAHIGAAQNRRWRHGM